MPDLPTSNTRRITLVKQHIHAGIPHRPGDVIELDRDLADWLIAEGAATAELPESIHLNIPYSKDE